MKPTTRNPHVFLTFLGNTDPFVRAIGRAPLHQAAVFFASDGTEVIHPEPARFFETPIQEPLPEDLNYIP